MVKINKTKNYSLFKSIPGNRAIKPSNLSALKRAMAEKNMLEYRPVLVNENMEVVDGQHRLEAAQSINDFVYYIVAHGLGLKEVQTLNSISKNWTLMDYIDSYCERGYKDYLYLKKFIEVYDIPVSVSIYLVGGWNRGSGIDADHTHLFKNGKFQAKFKDRAVKTGEFLKSIASKETHYRSRTFIFTIRDIIVNKECDEKRLLRVLDKGISKSLTKAEYLQKIQDAYNKRLSKAKKKLFVEL